MAVGVKQQESYRGKSKEKDVRVSNIIAAKGKLYIMYICTFKML